MCFIMCILQYAAKIQLFSDSCKRFQKKQIIRKKSADISART